MPDLPSAPTAALPWVFDRSPLSHLDAADRARVEQWGQGPRVQPSHALVHQAFEAQVWRQPDAVAVRHGDAAIRFGDLERQANRLARELHDRGVRPGDAVGVFLRRGLPMVVAILACLKVGAAYVPQCAGIAPPEQLRHIAAATRMTLVLGESHLRHTLPSMDGVDVLDVDLAMARPMDRPDLHEVFVPARRLSGDDRCFVLFTSGTTGVPNGVQVTHHNVCNILLTAPGDLGMRPGITVAQLLNIGFDMAAWETLGALAHGATLLIREDDFQAAAEQAQVLIATPSILARIDPARCRRVETVAVAGEPCPRSLADRWARQCRFYNACGPTEVTIVNTMHHHRVDQAGVCIGRPTPNNTVYVLDADMKACAIGEVGEMWAGGDCVTPGYLGQPGLTAERYRPDPFLGGGRMMFRTRDLGRWNEHGELEHLGRVDDQVKVRGFRVELDAVSAQLEKAPRCRQAVTLKLNDRDLVAFVTPADTDLAAARAQVARQLPYYCMPRLVIALPALPMTARGKVDKRQLLAQAARELQRLDAQASAPQELAA